MRPHEYNRGEGVLSVAMPTGTGSVAQTLLSRSKGGLVLARCCHHPLNLPVGARACLCLEQKVSNDGDICTVLRVG